MLKIQHKTKISLSIKKALEEEQKKAQSDETAFDDLKDFTIITYKQSINEKEVGTIGIIGPKRMDYKKVIPVIKYIGDSIQEKIKQGGEVDGRKREDKE